MAMYKEVKKRQSHVEKETIKRDPKSNNEQRELRGDFIGFTFKHRGKDAGGGSGSNDFRVML